MTKEARIYNREKDSLFNKWTAACKRRKLELYTKIKQNTSKWFKDLNVKPETMKLLEGNISTTLFNINYSNFFGSDFSGKGNRNKNKQMGPN